MPEYQGPRPGSFSLDVSKFVERAQGKMDFVLRKTALDIFSRVVDMSPVDTGRFRGNWIPAIGIHPTATFPEHYDKTGAGTKKAIAAEISKLKAGQRITLANNLPYAMRLEYGWSKQAPAGMVRVTAQMFQSTINAAARAAP